MNLQKNIKVIISGGGTGGHIFPAISIANALRRIDPATEILFVGAEGRMEMQEIPSAGYRIIGLPVEGLDRKNLLRNIRVSVRLLKSLRMAKRIISDFKPDVVAGVGGYASGPVLRQASRMGIPTLIQEQNSYAGVANRLLAGKASVICVAYDGMERFFPAEKIVRTGNPVRLSFENLQDRRDEALAYFNLTKGKPVILVLGGSLGAGSINKSLTINIDKIAASDYQWLWQTGKHYYEDILRAVSALSGSNISVQGFITRMDLAYAASDVIISRAGAGTISELCLAGKPAILVPSPNVAEDHQTSNARALTEKEAAVLVPDDQVADKLVDEAISLAGDSGRRRILGENIFKMADPGADMRIAQEIIKLAGA